MFLRIGFLFCLFSSFTIAQEQVSNPYQLVERVASTTFGRMKNEWATNKGDPEVLKTIIREEMLPHIDHQFAAYKVLGKNFRVVPKDKLQRYIDVFQEYLVSSYSIALGYYDDQQVIFEPARDLNNRKFIVVRGIIKGTDGPDIDIAFKVRKTGIDKTWKAYDLVAEGISLVDSKRSEFGAVIRNGDIDEVISIMQKTIDGQSVASLNN